MKIIAKSKRIKSFFGLVFPLIYIPYPLYYNYKNPGAIVIDGIGVFLITCFLCLTVAYYIVNGYGFSKSLFCRNIVEFDDDISSICIYSNECIGEFDWTDFSIVYSFGLPFLQIRKNEKILSNVYLNCADIRYFPKKKVRNKRFRISAED